MYCLPAEAPLWCGGAALGLTHGNIIEVQDVTEQDLT